MTETVKIEGGGDGILIAGGAVIFLIIISLIVWAMNPDMFKKKKGDKCEIEDGDIRGTYEIDKEGKCVLKKCDTGWEVLGDGCSRVVTPSDPTPGPADPTPGPADPTPGPADPTPGPADPTPGPADPTPGPASVDCVGSWGEWSTCTKTCGGGTQVRSYNITTKPVLNGAACPTSPEERVCNETACPVEKVIPTSSVNPDDPNKVPSNGWLVAPNGNMIWPRDDGTVGQYPYWRDVETVWSFVFDSGTKKHRLVKDGDMYWTSDFKLRHYPLWNDPKTLWEIKLDTSTGKYWLIAPTNEMIYLARDDSDNIWEHSFWPDPTTLWEIVPT